MTPDLGSASDGVTLHASWVCSRFQQVSVSRGAGQTAFRPVLSDLNIVTHLLKLLYGFSGESAFEHDVRACCHEPEGAREMLVMKAGSRSTLEIRPESTWCSNISGVH